MKNWIGPKILLSLATFILTFGFSFSQDRDTANLRIMTYNIWNGFDWGKDTTRKSDCITWIRSQNPDILALQELCGYDEQQLRDDALLWGHPYVQILKTEGYPTALTSKQPIETKERITESFWHGLLHCMTYGIDFFVVHLSPADSQIRLQEAKQITEKIAKLDSDAYIILGDFNAISPMDATWVHENQSLKSKYSSNQEDKYSNLRLGEFDYSVISEFLACPSVDVCLGKVNLEEGHTFPTPILIGKYDNTSLTIVENRVRIDYILASPSLAKSCKQAHIFNQKETSFLSDHYPVIAEFTKID